MEPDLIQNECASSPAWRRRASSGRTFVHHDCGFESSAFRMESERWSAARLERGAVPRGAEDRALRFPLYWNVIWLVGASPSATR